MKLQHCILLILAVILSVAVSALMLSQSSLWVWEPKILSFWENAYTDLGICDQKLSVYYEKLLLCLQSISNPEKLDINIAEPSNEVSRCANNLNREELQWKCYFQSDYRLLEVMCRRKYQFLGNEVLNQLQTIPCMQSYSHLIGSWSGIMNAMKQIDWSSFTQCYQNSDCHDDEYCSVQWVVRCEKIIDKFDRSTILINEKQLIDIIKNKSNIIIWWWDSHSHVNYLKISDGHDYVVRDVSVLWLVSIYYTQDEMSKMQLWIE